jgi:hypothetical protein
MAAAVKQMPKAMSLTGCGAGHARDARAIYHHGRKRGAGCANVQPVGAWMAEDGGTHASVMYRHGNDARMFPEGVAITAAQRNKLAPKLRAACVPGYIGVSTAEDDAGRLSIPWAPDYDGMFRVHVWDTSRAIFRSGGDFGNVEEAAREYDLIATVLACGDPVDTNYPVPDDDAAGSTKSPNKSARTSASASASASASQSAAASIQKLSSGATATAPAAAAAAAAQLPRWERRRFTKHGAFSAMQLIDVEDHLTWNAVEGKATEWDAWRDGVRADFLHTATTTENANAFAQKMAWLGQRLKREAGL